MTESKFTNEEIENLIDSLILIPTEEAIILVRTLEDIYYDLDQDSKEFEFLGSKLIEACLKISFNIINVKTTYSVSIQMIKFLKNKYVKEKGIIPSRQ